MPSGTAAGPCGDKRIALSDARRNIVANYRFHCSVRGGLFRRLAYLTAYYSIFIVFRRGDRHLRCLDWLKRSGFSDIPVEVETADHLRLRLDLHTAFDPLHSIIGDKDYEQIASFRPSAGQVVLDAGANVGIFTTDAAKRVGESGRVVAIEPHPDNFRLLTGNVERNGLRNVSLVQAALDEHSGSAELFVHERGINHSLKRRTGRSVPVALKTIDQVAREQALDRVDLIKIDTEGNVPAILRGARETIGRYRPRIVFERDSPEESRGLRELFEEFGYDTQDIRCFTYACPKA